MGDLLLKLMLLQGVTSEDVEHVKLALRGNNQKGLGSCKSCLLVRGGVRKVVPNDDLLMAHIDLHLRVIRLKKPSEFSLNVRIHHLSLESA